LLLLLLNQLVFERQTETVNLLMLSTNQKIKYCDYRLDIAKSVWSRDVLDVNTRDWIPLWHVWRQSSAERCPSMNVLMDAPTESGKCDAGSHKVTWFKSGSDGNDDEIIATIDWIHATADCCWPGMKQAWKTWIHCKAVASEDDNVDERTKSPFSEVWDENNWKADGAVKRLLKVQEMDQSQAWTAWWQMPKQTQAVLFLIHLVSRSREEWVEFSSR